MLRKFPFKIYLITLLFFCSCAKEEIVYVLKDSYDPLVTQADLTTDDFIVSLNARALQNNERGEWSIIQGEVIEPFVYFTDKTNPFTKFKGLPGVEYTLEWKFTSAGKTKTTQTKVQIPELNIEIADQTPTNFQTIRFLFVNPKYRGTWSVDREIGYITSKYHDGYAESPEKKPSIELHGYANIDYIVTYTYEYAGRSYKFNKAIRTGNYTEDEGLYELQMNRGSTRVIEDDAGNILELNLQASGTAWIFNEINKYPSLQSFKKIRRLILGGSSLGKIPDVFGDHYLDLEELDLDRVGSTPVFPANFGNMTKLKKLIVDPLYSVDRQNIVQLPASFAKMHQLESLIIMRAGLIDFNGTMGGLKNLKRLEASVLNLPDNIGDLTKLEHLDVFVNSSQFPQRFIECKSLKFARFNFADQGSSELVFPQKMENLINLEHMEITSAKLRNLPASFCNMPALRRLSISALNLQSIPSNIGNLTNMENLTIYGGFRSVPSSIGDLKKMTNLFLGGYAETLPESFGNLTALEYFNAESSELRTLPSSFGNLKKLKEITLALSKIESLPPSFGELDALEKLNLSVTRLSTFPSQIIRLKNIKNVMLSNTRTGDIPDDIAKIKSGVVFTMYSIPNLTDQHLQHVLDITRNLVFYTDFGYMTSYR